MRSLFLIVLTSLFIKCSQADKSDVKLDQRNVDKKVEKANAYFEIGDSLYYVNEFEEAIKWYHKAIQKIEDGIDLKLESNLTNDIGLSYKKMGIADSAIKYYQYAAALDLKLKDSANLIGRWRNLANVYKNQGRYSISIELLTACLQVAQNLKNERSAAATYNSIGGIYLQQDNYQKAIGYYKSAQHIYQNIEEQKREAFVLNNLGVCYEEKGDYDSALFYYNASKDIKLNLDLGSLSSTLDNIGSVYGKLRKWDSSFFYLSTAYDIREGIRDQRGLASTANALAEYHLEVGKPKLASPYLEQAAQYAIDQDDRRILQENYFQKANYYEQIGAAVQALKYFKLWSTLKDSVFNQEKILTAQIQFDYELDGEEKGRQLAEQQVKLAETKASKRLIASVVLALFLFLLSGFSFIFYKQRRKLIALNKELKVKGDKIELLNKQNVHFTKNSLAGIVGMLNSQIKRLDDGKLRSTLVAERLRMETISLLYRQLFLDDSSDRVRIKPFLEGIVTNTMESLLGSDFANDLKLNISDVALQNEEALSLGMIVNEASLNACKYAFSLEKRFFTVTLKEQSEKLVLEISDSGPGFPLDLDWRTSSSFGLQLIRLLALDLKGDLDVESTNSGVTYNLNIPLVR